MIAALIELLVCALLVTTIGYCIVLDRRLRRLKADEDVMRRTVAELTVATEKAERAVAGLRGLVNECDATIAGHLRAAERQADDLASQIRSGDEVIARIARIVESARTPIPAPASEPTSPPVDAAHGQRLAATVAAAQAFADRAQRRVRGQAA